MIINLLPQEEILLERRRFWLPILLQSIALFVVACVPFAVLTAADFLDPQIQALLTAYFWYFVFAAFAWVLIAWIAFAVAWTNYYLDVLVVTNKRIIDVDQIGLFARDVAEMRLEDIEDMKVEVLGLLPSLLGFGNLHIQTAAESNEFFLKNVPNPHEIRNLIARCLNEINTRQATPLTRLK